MYQSLRVSYGPSRFQTMDEEDDENYCDAARDARVTIGGGILLDDVGESQHWEPEFELLPFGTAQEELELESPLPGEFQELAMGGDVVCTDGTRSVDYFFASLSSTCRHIPYSLE